MTTETLPELRFRLPGEWWQLRLHDEEEARASIDRLVLRQVGKADDRAMLRGDLRRRLLAAVEKAIAGDGQSMYLALNIVEEVPLSASFTVFLPRQAMTPAVASDTASVLAVLERGLLAARPDDLAGAVRFSTGDSEVLRVRRSAAVPTDEEHDELPTLVADYWLTIPGTKRVVLVSFSTVFAELETPMLSLFDSIVRATYWQHPEP